MNAVPTSTTDFIEENGGDIDSDDNPEEFLEYYQPISTETGLDSDEDDTDPTGFNHLPNGRTHHIENGITSLDLNDEEDEEEERMREVEIAFVEDERRRQAPLSVENATRVMEAMRDVSFGGSAPDWANQVPEDQWIDQIRGIRQNTPPAAGSAS
ncbi:hypothetical protein Leryth_002749 [Lithospermum erythrorhizon]|nr:hypothetical protein Leryth_002749 [Lithospermum erythrorhizon]